MMLQEKIHKSVEYAKTITIPTYVFSLFFAIGTPITAYAFDWAVETNNKVIALGSESVASRKAMELDRQHREEFRKLRVKQLDSMEQDLKLLRQYIMENR